MDTSSAESHSSNKITLDEVDRRCLIALQAQPRATWRELGAASGIAERTVARRIQRLMDDHLVRVIAELEPLATGGGKVLHAWVRCKTGQGLAVAEKLTALPETQVVMSLAGSADIFTEINLPADIDFAQIIVGLLPGIEGVDRVETRLVLRPYRRTGLWRIQPETSVDVPAPSGMELVTLTENERRIVAALAADGRAGLSELADTSGVSEPTAQRLLQGLIDRKALTFRVEVEPALVGFAVEAIVSVQAKPSLVETIATHLAHDPHTRCLFGTSGSSQLFWHVLCRDALDLWDVVTRRLGMADGVLSSDVSMVAQAYKRCGIPREGVRLVGASRSP